MMATNLGYMNAHTTSIIISTPHAPERHAPTCPKHVSKTSIIESNRDLCLLLVVAHLLGLLQQLGGIVDSLESANGSIDTLVHQVAGDNNPESVHQDKVAPVVGGLGAGVGNIEDVVVEERGRVVENVTVELAQRDDELQRVAQRVVDGDEVGGEEGEGTPEGLRTSISKLFPADARQIHTAVTVSMHKTKASWVR
jgi:hypothetical protein